MKHVKTYLKNDLDSKIEHYGLRLCKIGDKYGWFHTWEHYIFNQTIVGKAYSKEDTCSSLWPYYNSKVYAIVEFPDGVRRVDPNDICFCDTTNKILKEINELRKENL